MKNVTIKVDENEGIFRKRDITFDEVKYLVYRGYWDSIQYDLYGNKDYYMLKPASNESCQHFFLIKAITKYLQEQGFQVWNYKTVKPDIIFEVQSRKIAIEVETGNNLRNNKKQFLKKVKCLNKNYGYNWFFVVTNRDLVKKYKKYGRTYTRKNVINGIARYVNFGSKNHMRKVEYY